MEALPPLAQAFAASLTAPGAPPAPAPSDTVFDLPPVAAVPCRELEPLPDATSWLPTLDDPALEPLPPQFSPSAEPFPDLLTTPEPEPEVSSASAAPMFTTTFGAASARPPKRVLPWVLLAAGLVLTAALFLLREPLMEMAGLGDGEQVAQAAPRPRRRPQASQVPPAAAPQTGASVVAEPPESTSEPAPEPTPEATPAPEPPLPAPARAVEPIPAVAEDSGPALTRLERITSEPQPGGGTDIILWGDGAIRAESFTRTRLDGNPPRELVRLSGIRRQFPQTRVTVGTPEVLQVRVGFHPETGGGELHVVLDLARPNVVVTGVEPGENRLRIRLQRK